MTDAATVEDDLVERLRERDCPKCGSIAIVPDQAASHKPLNRWTVGCLDCAWQTAPYETQEEAWAAWNAGPENDRIESLTRENAALTHDNAQLVKAASSEATRAAEARSKALEEAAAVCQCDNCCDAIRALADKG